MVTTGYGEHMKDELERQYTTYTGGDGTELPEDLAELKGRHVKFNELKGMLQSAYVLKVGQHYKIEKVVKINKDEAYVLILDGDGDDVALVIREKLCVDFSLVSISSDESKTRRVAHHHIVVYPTGKKLKPGDRPRCPLSKAIL
ncbi:MAG: hypothetical protein JKY53_00105 [Flavobacteriales bacterium]|nr:hypothetical protein [Flavobacteriales bacterium]